MTTCSQKTKIDRRKGFQVKIQRGPAEIQFAKVDGI